MGEIWIALSDCTRVNILVVILHCSFAKCYQWRNWAMDTRDHTMLFPSTACISTIISENFHLKMEKNQITVSTSKRKLRVIQSIFQNSKWEWLLFILVLLGVSFISLGNNHVDRIHCALTMVERWSIQVMLQPALPQAAPAQETGRGRRCKNTQSLRLRTSKLLKLQGVAGGACFCLSIVHLSRLF